MRPSILASPLAALLCLEASVFCFLALRPSTGDTVLAYDTHLKSTRWWALHRFPFDDRSRDIRVTKDHFTRFQWRHFSPRRCSFDPEMVRATLQGVHTALRECESQMAAEKWNCTRYIEHYTGLNIFGRLLVKGIPETAFVLAIVSAGVTASIASECRRSLSCCPCRRSDFGDVQSGAQSGAPTRVNAECEHNIKFAKRFARKLFDRSVTGRGINNLMMLHNYNAGRRVVMKSMKKRCLCHGTSGSCTHRTCWREVSNFQEIGERLKKEYENPMPVERGSPVTIHSRRRGTRRWGRRPQLNIVVRDAKEKRPIFPPKSRLVYCDSVPTDFFCSARPAWGVKGPRGRVCPAEGCGKVCCGRPHKVEYYRHIDHKCNCKFVWCCDVKCETCRSERRRLICD